MGKLPFIPNNDFMRTAIKLAEKAQKNGDVPVGAVITKNGEIISDGYNQREALSNAILHAEICAITSACEKLGTWRLSECEIYVTLEPCPMCTGAIINARIPRVIFGAFDEKAGSCGSVINLFDLPYNHHAEVWGGILEAQCSEMLSTFFKIKR